MQIRKRERSSRRYPTDHVTEVYDDFPTRQHSKQTLNPRENIRFEIPNNVCNSSALQFIGPVNVFNEFKKSERRNSGPVHPIRFQTKIPVFFLVYFFCNLYVVNSTWNFVFLCCVTIQNSSFPCFERVLS